MDTLKLLKNHAWLGAALLATLLAGCEPPTGSDPGTPGDDDDDTSTSSGTVQGRVSDSGARDVEGMVVTAATLDANGELVTVSETSATTDANGEYSLEIILEDGESMSDVIITAEGESQGSWSVIVSDEIEANAVATAAPINVETTSESRLLVALAANGMWDSEVMTSAMLRASVDAELAADLEGESSTSTELTGTAEAIASAMTAWSWTLDAEAVGGVSGDAHAVAELIADAQTELDAALDAAVDAEAEAEAVANYEAAIDAAFDAANIGDSQAYAAAIASVEAIGLTSGSASSDSSINLMADFAAEQAEAMAETAITAASALDVSAEANQIIAEANTNLTSAISVAAEGATDVQAMADAFASATEDWGVAVMGAIQTELDAEQQLALGAVIDAAAEASAAFEAALTGTEGDAMANAEAATEAIGEFFTELDAESLVGDLEAEGLTAAQAGATIGVIGSAFSSFNLDLGFIAGIVTDSGIDLSNDEIEILAIDESGIVTSLTGSLSGEGTSDGEFLASLDLTKDLGVQQVVEVVSESGMVQSAIVDIDQDGAFFGGVALNNETTTEVNTLIEAMSSGSLDTSITSVAELQAMISAAVAEATASSDDTLDAEGDLAIAFGLITESRQELLTTVGESQATIDAALAATTEAQAQLDEALFLAETSGEITAAFEAYAEAMSTVWTDAGVDSITASWIQLVEFSTLASFASEVMTDENVAVTAMTQLATDLSAALEAGIAQELSNFGASSAGMAQLEALVSDLEASIDTASQAATAGQVEALLSSSMDTFANGVVSLLVTEADSGVEATAISTFAGSVMSESSSLTSALDDLDVNLDGADGVVSTLLDFDSEVNSSTSTAVMSTVSMSNSEIDAVASIMSMVTAAGAF